MIDIRGLDKARVLQALFNGTRMNNFKWNPISRYDSVSRQDHLEYAQAKAILKNQQAINTLFGTVLGIDLSSDEAFDDKTYALYNGGSYAQQIIDSLRRIAEGLDFLDVTSRNDLHNGKKIQIDVYSKNEEMLVRQMFDAQVLLRNYSGIGLKGLDPKYQLHLADIHVSTMFPFGMTNSGGNLVPFFAIYGWIECA